MTENQRQFIEFALAHQALRFGTFTLKSGRNSPYFFNLGCFNSGASLRVLGEFYATCIQAAGIEFDMLFGPAYKGIPLVASISIAFSQLYHRDIPFCFNRKETKDHGEGGQLVGSALQGKVIIVDDVITAGTAINEVYPFLQQANAELAGIAIALNRQEKTNQGENAIANIEKKYETQVLSLIQFQDLLDYLQVDQKNHATLKLMQAYYQQFGC